MQTANQGHAPPPRAPRRRRNRLHGRLDAVGRRAVRAASPADPHLLRASLRRRRAPLPA
jgi:hypothetical protein